MGLTGTPAMQKKLSALLREQGARVFGAQTMEVRPLPFSLKGLLEGRPWLVFTSGSGVRRFFRALTEQETDVRALAGCRFAAVGAATEKVLLDHGIRADLRPEESTTAALGEALLRAASPEEPLLLLRSAQADAALAERLGRAGHLVRDLRIYDVRPRHDEREDRAARLAEADYLVFSSAGGVRAFLEEFGALPSGAVCVCIGAVTAAALEGRPCLTAPDISAEGILEAVLAHAAARRDGRHVPPAP